MVTIYGKPDCAYCVASCQLLEANNIDYQYVDVMLGDNFSEFQQHFPDTRTLPQFTVNGKPEQGGFVRLKKMVGDGLL